MGSAGEMATERHEDGFIPSIHNYCDRWCERCAFSSRCRAYAIEMAIAGYGPEEGLASCVLDPDAPDAEGDTESVEGWEGDDEPDADIEGEMVRHEAARLLADVHPLADAAKALCDLAQPLMDAAAARSQAGGPAAAAFGEAEEVLARYRYLIRAKLHRALSGRESHWTPETEEEATQSDANGSAKIAHITCDTARAAALRLAQLDPALGPQAAEFARTAERVLALIDEAFPHHRAFRRPGFDDIAGV